MAAGPGDYYVYGPQDLRTRFFASLGFETPPEVERLVGDGFGEPVSAERLDLLDQDVLVIYGDREALEDDPRSRGCARSARTASSTSTSTATSPTRSASAAR